MDFTNVSQNYEAGTKVLASQFVFGLSRKTQWLSGLYYADFISFTALLNCAEVGRRNRILTNYRFLSHSQEIEFLGNH